MWLIIKKGKKYHEYSRVDRMKKSRVKKIKEELIFNAKKFRYESFAKIRCLEQQIINYFKLKKIVRASRNQIRTVVSSVCLERFWVDSFGSFHQSPSKLVLLISVGTDGMKRKLESDQKLMGELRNCLLVNNYPKDALSSIKIYFISTETVVGNS
jgi:1,2-phenylacetyl-CoA epoxidase catalytic subunit